MDGISNSLTDCFLSNFPNSEWPQVSDAGMQRAFHGGEEINKDDQPQHVQQQILQDQAPGKHVPWLIPSVLSKPYNIYPLLLTIQKSKLRLRELLGYSQDTQQAVGTVTMHRGGQC